MDGRHLLDFGQRDLADLGALRYQNPRNLFERGMYFGIGDEVDLMPLPHEANPQAA